MINVSVKPIEKETAALSAGNGAEIALMDPLVYLSYPDQKELVDAGIILKTAPSTSSLIVLLKVNGSTVCTLTVATGQTTSGAAVFSDPIIPAGNSFQVVISQTGVSPNTGKDGTVFWRTR